MNIQDKIDDFYDKNWDNFTELIDFLRDLQTSNDNWKRKCSKYKNIINKITKYAQDLRLYDNESLEFKISEDLFSILDLENLGDD